MGRAVIEALGPLELPLQFVNLARLNGGGKLWP